MTELNGHSAANGNRVVPQSNGKATYAEKHKLAGHFIGGNRLENAPPSKVKDFVAEHDGHTVITNVRCVLGNGPLAAIGSCDDADWRLCRF
jgi:acetyl-CoA carboxylase/biotin carboxylase 1